MAADSNRPSSNSGLSVIRLPQKGITYRHKESDVRNIREERGVTFEADSSIIVSVMK
jgi:hypothetical protein